MRYLSSACVLSVCLMAAAPVRGQTPAEQQLVAPPSWAFNDLACAPGLAPVATPNTVQPAYRVIGSQDTVIRALLGPGDTLVISGGSNAGLQTGQRYFLRRLVQSRAGSQSLPVTVHTAGWVQILGVDTAVATATVMHACDGILIDDYLEPFTPPMIAARPSSGTTPHYENMGHIVTGLDGSHTAGKGQVMTIDRGSNGGVFIGQRFLVFRARGDQRYLAAGRSKELIQTEGHLPLVQIGEVLVIAVQPDSAAVQVLTSKDAVTSGDLIAPIQ